MSQRLYCPKCDNTESFNTPTVEYHSWAVDNQGDFVEDLGSEDSKKSGHFFCGKCGGEVGEVEYCDTCEKPHDKCTCGKEPEFESRVRVVVSFYVGLSTDGHPDDIPQEEKNRMVFENALNYLRNLDLGSMDTLIDEYYFDETKQV